MKCATRRGVIAYYTVNINGVDYYGASQKSTYAVASMSRRHDVAAPPKRHFDVTKRTGPEFGEEENETGKNGMILHH